QPARGVRGRRLRDRTGAYSRCPPPIPLAGLRSSPSSRHSLLARDPALQGYRVLATSGPPGLVGSSAKRRVGDPSTAQRRLVFICDPARPLNSAGLRLDRGPALAPCRHRIIVHCGAVGSGLRGSAMATAGFSTVSRDGGEPPSTGNARGTEPVPGPA